MDPQLYRAAATGDIDFFKKIPTDIALQPLLLGCLSSKSPKENTVLHIVASQGHDQIVELVVRYCPSLLKETNSVGDTPLHVAARGGHLSTVNSLLKCARTFSASSSTDVEAGNVELKDLLRIKNSSEDTALHEALKSGHEQVAMLLIETNSELWCENPDEEGRSPLYLAAEMGFLDLIEQISKSTVVEPNGREWLRQSKSPVKAAIKARNMAVLEELMTLEPEFSRLRDEDGRIPLHHAAFFGYLEGFLYLIKKYAVGAYKSDENGSFPIHLASRKGHIDIIKALLERCPDSKELRDKNGENILHNAARSGKQNVVSYILRTQELGELINERSVYGNTALHLATVSSQPKVVSILTWDKRVDMKLQNKFGFTARDLAGEYMEAMAPFRERLTWLALKISRAPRSKSSSRRVVNNGFKPKTEAAYKDMVNTLLLVATLVATVTFAAGFQIPGGLNDTDPDKGMATMLKKSMFHVFVTCDTIAMCSSITAVVVLIWAQVGDVNLVLSTLKWAVPLLGLALTMMSLAFIASVYLVVAKLTWVAIFVLVVALVFLVGTMTIFVLFWFPDSSDNVVTRYMSYYAFWLLLFATGNHEGEEVELKTNEGEEEELNLVRTWS